MVFCPIFVEAHDSPQDNKQHLGASRDKEKPIDLREIPQGVTSHSGVAPFSRETDVISNSILERLCMLPPNRPSAGVKNYRTSRFAISIRSSPPPVASSA